MTDTAAEPTAPIDTAAVNDPKDADASRLHLLLLKLGVIASVVPFFWAAVRDARNGFYPTLDVASTVVRGRATLSAHPPLYGMWSSGSSWAGHEIHFPGPILLWLLAVPVHVLGNSWGTLLAMATINASFMVVAVWLVYRRVGAGAALLTLGTLNLFIWSIGSENLVDARPMEMVTVPFLCFLIVVWLVTSGDFDALPVLAIVANYLFLNHLVMALQIPVIGLCAVAGTVYRLRGQRAPRDGEAAVAHDPPARRWRPLRRRLLQTFAITFVMWLPSLIQEITTRPGNLTLLLQAGREHRQPVGSYVVGYNATLRLIAKPPFWFRGRFDNASYPLGLQNLTPGDVLIGVLLAATLIGLGIVSWRRRDPHAVAALVVAVVAIVASIETVTQAPAVWGFPVSYLRSLWGLAAFVWFAIAFSIYRWAHERLRVKVSTLAGVGAVVFGILGLSYADYGSAVDMHNSGFARQVVHQVVPQVQGRGRIHVISGPDFTSQTYFASLLLGLDTARVPYCVDHKAAQQYGAEHDCASQADETIFITAPLHPDVPRDAELVSRVRLRTAAEDRELAHTRSVVDAWLESHHEVTLTPEAREMVERSSRMRRTPAYETLQPPDGDITDLMSSPTFRLLVGLETRHRDDPTGNPPIFADSTMPVGEMARYFELTNPLDHGNIWVYRVPNGWTPSP